MDKETARRFRTDFAEAVKTLEQQYGMTIELGNISFTANSLSVKLTAREGADKDTAYELEFKRLCGRYGLQASDYDRLIEIKGEDYVIYGINSNKRKHPILIRRVKDDKVYCISPEYIKQLIRK